ncbi:hypothetical protein [Streptomyces sp. NBC_01408]|uniref:hypothetical protein n=1 Tax=Streptomyces sp. NBC_01408 TaxID=2903855 RepID=UPI002259F2E5|nr:hypothetical protein [Streptomyces sp. NBC_01408]MCX4693636.1 hypothetical protein [Streptomyces sp. NBC_01408]
MGGREHTRGGSREGVSARLGVLLMAFGVLAGAVFLCARPGEVHTAAGEPGHPAHSAHAAHLAPLTHDAHDAHVVCLSPYEPPGCSGLSHVTPGVLPVPPPAVAVGRTGPVPAARPALAGRPRPAGTLARAPDLHALQVLRT